MSEVKFVPPTSAEMRSPAPPMVTLWRVLVRPYKPPKVAPGGKIELADVVIENMKFLTTVGKVCAMGEQAYQSPKLKDGNNPTVDSWVIYGKYAGQRVILRDGSEYLILNDDEIIAVVDNPADYMQFA